MEKYIVAALTASLPKYEQCIVAKETDVIIATHSKVFGPDSKEACEKWMAENCSGSANPGEPKYIVAALTVSSGTKYEQCIVAKETDVIPATHSKVYGPASKAECEKWAAENCGNPATNTPPGDTKAVRPRVYTAQDLAADPRLRPDGYVQKIVKYVPSEIVAAYVALASYLQPVTADGKPVAAATANNMPTWYVFWFLLVLSPIYIYFFTWEPNKPRPIYQTIAAPFAFVAWVIAIEGPVASYFRTATGVQGIGMIVLIGVFLLILLGERVYEILTTKSQPSPQ